ncbi:MAG: SIR2 family protein [Ferruginibacter sp.]|nr:SIR2 family protein [Ferruginibacter sp.]
MAIQYNGHKEALQNAYMQGRLSLYLGAGVSKASGLPSWEEFVQALYFTTLNDESYIYEMKPFPNYLFALAEWVLKQKNEPLDIIIRKIKQWYEGKDFIGMMSKTLYAGLDKENFGDSVDEELLNQLLSQNTTLNAVVTCCKRSVPGVSGVRSVITYNYDNLVEIGLKKYPGSEENFQIIYKKEHAIKPGRIPIYHVHGYIPYQDDNINYDDIIFSEDQYNRAFQDPFFWGNVVQVNQLTSSTGLMIGQSLSDRNTRRILDSIRNQPLPNNNYILMRRPQFKNIGNPSPELDEIRSKAEKYLDKFPRGRMKMPDREPAQIQNILNRIYEYEQMEFEKGFETLGLNLITYDDFGEIATVLEEISHPGG